MLPDRVTRSVRRALLIGALALLGSAAAARAETGDKLGLKVTLGAGAVYLVDPMHEIRDLRVASLLGVNWAPGRIPGEIGLAAVLDNTHLLAMRADLRFFFYKGDVFSQYTALDFDFVPSLSYLFGGGGLMFGFEWAVAKHVGVAWAFGADFVTYPVSVAPPVTGPIKADRPPRAFAYVLPSSTLGVQARF